MINFIPTHNAKPTDPVPLASLVAVTQAALGCGIGLLLAGKLRRPAQKAVAVAMLSLGVASTLPIIIELFAKYYKGPTSARGVRKRLDSIRQDAGVSEDAEVF
jgi:hypothetical protein